MATIDIGSPAPNEWNSYSSKKVSEGYPRAFNREITRERLRTVSAELKSNEEFSRVSFAQMSSAMKSLDDQIDQLSDDTESERYRVFGLAAWAALLWIASLIVAIQVCASCWSAIHHLWTTETAKPPAHRAGLLVDQFVSGLGEAEFLLTTLGVVSLFLATIGTTRATKRAWNEFGRTIAGLAAPSLRSFINQQADLNEPTKLSVSEAPALAHQEHRDRLVHRPESDRIYKLITKLGASAIAISGNRGVGKTTLMRNMAGRSGESSTWINVHVAAPVGYDARDFLIHLYTRLCDAILENLEPSRRQSVNGRVLFRRYIRLGIRLSCATLIATILLQLVASFLAANVNPASAGDPIRSAARFTEFILGSIGFERMPRGGALALILIGLLTVYTAAGRFKYTIGGYYPRLLARKTEEQLRRLRFIQTTSTNWSGGVKRGPFDFSRSRNRQLAELPLSLPELVESYRVFATSISDSLLDDQSGIAVVISIDEMDRISDGTQAERFLNEIKAIFNVPGYVYLVSVSEEAIASFERRVVQVRTALDSTFDEVIRLDTFLLAQSLDLLRRRVTGLPATFVTLCHCLAGGVPRDLVRAARALLEVKDDIKHDDLSRLAAGLISHEIATLRRGILSRIFSSDAPTGPEGRELVSYLLAEEAPARNARDLRKISVALMPDENADGPTAEASRHLSVAMYFYSIVLETFTTQVEVVQTALASPESPEGAYIEGLAQVRGLLRLSPLFARIELSRLHDALGALGGQGSPAPHS